MKLTMLGYDYGFAPSQNYLRANGRGYVGGSLGQVTQAQDPELYAAVQAYKGRYPEKWPSSASDGRVMEIAAEYKVDPMPLYMALSLERDAKASEAVSRIQSGIASASEIAKAMASGLLSIAQAIAAIRGSNLPKSDQDKLIGSLQWQQYIPWIIGGGAVLVGVLLVTGTMRGRRRG